MYIIAVAGSKGKTTIVRILDQILHELGEKTFRVDTQHVAINNSILSGINSGYSMEKYGHGLAVKPGKHLGDIDSAQNIDTAIFEASIGCWHAGLGYDKHDVGILTNIYTEHLNKQKGILNQKDIANKKSFIYKNIKSGGTAIINLDDELALNQAKKIPADIKKIGFSLTPAEHLPDGFDALVFENENQIYSLDKKGKKPIVNTRDVEWTFDGKYRPSVINLLIVIGALLAKFGNINQDIATAIKQTKMPKGGGRLVLLKDSEREINVLLDYAHEENSFQQIAQLGNSLSSGQLIGVIRLAPRSDEKILSIAKVISQNFDKIFLYQKYDGSLHIPRTPERLKSNTETTDKLFSELKNLDCDVSLLRREDAAIKAAINFAKKSDTIIQIVHDNTKQSEEFTRSILNS